MKTIVLFDTSIGSLNQGDEIINRSIKSNWSELFDKSYYVRLASHTPLYTPLQCALYKDSLKIFNNADYKFLCGTNAIYTNMFRPRPAWNINLVNCGMAKNTICLGVGIGENGKKANLYTRLLYNKVLSHNYIHSVRDRKSEDFLIGLGFKALNTGCPTLWGITEDLCQKIPAHKSPKVVFTLTYYAPDIDNDKKMISILAEEYEELFFWPQCYKDLEYMQSLAGNIAVSVVTPNLDAYEHLLLEQDIDYVGNRLHGGVFAIQHCRRAIIISIDYRAQNMKDDYSLPIIQRNNLSNILRETINGEWETKITGIDINKINTWKGQFEI